MTITDAAPNPAEIESRLEAVLAILADARPAIIRAATSLASIEGNASADVTTLDQLADLIAELRPEVLDR